MSPADGPRDPGRRQFFRAFGRQTVSGAGNVLRAADELRRGSTAAAGELLGLGLRDPGSSAARLEQAIATAAPAETRALAEQGVAPTQEAPGFRSPYLFSGDSLLLIDQRMPLEPAASIVCRDASEVATAIGSGVAGGGPVLAQVAAYGLLLALVGSATRPPQARQAAFSAAANTLRAARPAAHAVAGAVERVTRRWQRLADDADVEEQLAAVRAEAEQLAMEAALDHARLGRNGAGALPAVGGRPISLLLHGDMGPLSGGLVGTGFAIVQAALSAGREVHVWLTEAAPGLEGARLAAPQLGQADVPHTVIPDSAVGWLVAEQPLDAVLLRADHVCANGDTGALIGSLGVARLARAAGVPVHACAPTIVLDPGTASGADLARSRTEPELDVVPSDAIDAFISEEGVHRPPYENSLAAALSARAARRAQEG